MYRFGFIAILASASASIIFDSPCPTVKSVDNFDFNSYAKGVWYEIARYPNPSEENGQCGTTEYKIIEHNMAKVTNYDVKNRRLRFIDGLQRLAPDAGNTGKVIVSLPYGENGAFTNNIFNVLSIDYDSYVVGYYCKYDEAKKSRQDFAWILSRCKSLSTNARAAVEQTIRENKFLDMNNFLWTSFCDQDCRAYA